MSAYSALPDAPTDALVTAFRAAYPATGVDVLSRAQVAELYTRVRVERNAPKADVLIGGDWAFHAGLAKEGLLAGSSSPWYVGVLAFGSKVRPVASWDELLDPEWKGKVVLPDPEKTALGYVFLATQVFRFGRDEDAAMAYMKKLDRQLDRYVGRATQALELVGAGTDLGAPMWAHEVVARGGIAFALPDPTGTELGAISVLGGGARPDATKVFVDWLLSKEGGDLLVRSMGVTSTRTDVAGPSRAQMPPSGKLVPYDRAWAAAERERLIDKWRATIGRSF